MKILAIETSCDETAAAVVEKTEEGWVEVWGEAVASSNQMHVKTGGIVPEVASREQLVSMIPVVEEAMKQAASNSKFEIRNSKQVLNSNNQIRNWARENIDAIAVTVGPGLIGSLLVGVETAKTLALAWDKPLVPVNHIMGHLYANYISNTVKQRSSETVPKFPAIALIVSGGHTELILMKDRGRIQLLGSTRDDAAGECLDKCARVMGLPYPGGPEIAASAAKFEILPAGRQGRNSKFEIKLPRPLLHEDTYDFSFSGLKIAVLRIVQQQNSTTDKQIGNDLRAELAFELQEAVVECLAGKLMKAVEEFKPRSVLIAGGVAANSCLRRELELRIMN